MDWDEAWIDGIRKKEEGWLQGTGQRYVQATALE